VFLAEPKADVQPEFRSFSMKTVLLLTFCWMAAASAQTSDYPLRRFGTNIYDFTPLMQSFQRREIVNTPYFVTGEAFPAKGNSAQIVRKMLNKRLSQDFRKNLLLAGPAEQLKMLYAQKVIERWRNGQASSGEFLVLDPEMKRIVSEEIEREKEDYTYVRVFVTNCPAIYLIKGKEVALFAFPTGGSTYNYGETFLGNSEKLPNVFLVTAQGIRKKETLQEVAAKKAITAANLLVWQHQQASNGVAYVQYDLSKRYFEGNGVTNDVSMGFYWLRRAAAQDYEPALKLLETVERTNSNISH
jgi:hypothetical protein